MQRAQMEKNRMEKELAVAHEDLSLEQQRAAAGEMELQRCAEQLEKERARADLLQVLEHTCCCSAPADATPAVPAPAATAAAAAAAALLVLLLLLLLLMLLLLLLRAAGMMMALQQRE